MGASRILRGSTSLLDGRTAGPAPHPRLGRIPDGEQRPDDQFRVGALFHLTGPGQRQAWVRVDGDELVEVADLNALFLRPAWRRSGTAGADTGAPLPGSSNVRGYH